MSEKQDIESEDGTPNNKTEEEKQKEAEFKAIRQAYYEETGQPLILNPKEAMQTIKDEMSRLAKETNLYQAPTPDWNDVMTQQTHRKKWVKIRHF